MQENENCLEKFLIALNTVEIIERLEKIVLATVNDGVLKIGMLAYDKENLNLFVSTNQKMNPNDEPKLSEEIMLALGYDFTLAGCEIFIHYPSLFSKNETELFDAIIDITKENLVSGKLSAFLSTYYSEYFKLPNEQNVISAVRPRTTERKNSDEENVLINPEVEALLVQMRAVAQKHPQHKSLIVEEAMKLNSADNQFVKK